MTIKITTPNGGSDSLDFGCAQTAIVATVTGTEVSSGEGKLEFKTTTGGTSATKATVLANGNFGINVAAPTYKLDVNTGTAALGGVAVDLFRSGSLSSSTGGVLNLRPANGAAISNIHNLSIAAYDHSGDTNADGLSINAYDGVSFSTGSNSRQERMRITSAGKVGIGVTNPDLKMEIVDTSSGASKDALLLTNYGAASNTETGIFFSPTEADGAIRGARISALNDGADDSNSVALKFSTGLGAPPVERMRITSAGNVGIGTTPDSKLNVAAGDGATAVNQAILSGGRSLGAGAVGGAGALLFTNSYWDANKGAALISGVDSGSSGGELTFSTTTNGGGTTGVPTERMRIDSGGTVLMGQTTNPATATLVLKVSTGSANGVNAQITSNTGTSYPWSNYNASGTYVGGISCTSSATAFPTSSDVRLKKDIKDAPSAIEKIKAARVVSHEWKEEDTAPVEFGFVAQELIKVVPQAVIEGKDKEDGGIEIPWGVDYSKLVPLLVKTIQELEARIAKLEENK